MKDNTEENEALRESTNLSGQPQSAQSGSKGTVEARDITATNVAGANIYDHPTYIENYIHIASEEAPREQKRAEKSRPFILPQGDIPILTGREEELKRLEQLLLHSSGPRIARAGITGIGGVGKSALAFYFAWLHRDRFPHGVIGLRLDGKELNLLSLAQHLASLVGMKNDPEQELNAAQIMQLAFQDKQVLLIFDNVEETSIRDLNPGAGQCAIIVTTRNRALLRSFGITPDSSMHIDLKGFTLDETKVFLSKTLGEPGVARITAEPEAVQHIHNLVGGLPLALVIVGSALSDRLTSLAAYAEALRNEKERLKLLRDPDDPDLNVRASFELSLRFLNEDQITLFACLGVCAQEGFTLETARIVSDQSEATVGEGLARLFRLSLIGRGKTTGRYILHSLLYLFSRELARERQLLGIAAQRHTDYFFKYATEHRGLSPTDMDALEKELDALLLTAYRLTNNIAAANTFYRSLEPFLQAKGYSLEALELIDLFLPSARKANDFYRTAQFLLQRGQFLQVLARFEEAKQALLESKSAAIQIEELQQRQHILGMILNSLGSDYQQMGQLDQAIEVLQQSYEIRLALGEKNGQAMVLSSLGKVYAQLDKLDLAAEAYEESLVLEKEIGTPRGQAMVLTSLGSIYQRHRQFNKAVEAFEQSLAIEKKLGNESGQTKVLNSLGKVYGQLGNLDKAVETLQENYNLRVALGDNWGRAIVLNNLGSVYQQLGNLDKAVETLQEGYNLRVALGDEPGKAKDLHSLGGVYQRQGKLEKAIEAFRQSLDIEQEAGTPRGQALVLTSWGKALLNHNLFNEAAEKLKMGFEISENLRNIRGLRTAAQPLLEVLIKLNRADEAEEYYRRAIALAPGDKQLLSLQQRLKQPRSPSHQESILKTGRIKKLINHQKGYIYGFITPDDGSADIYFRKDIVDPALLPKLTTNLHVTAKIEMTDLGPRAWHVS